MQMCDMSKKAAERFDQFKGNPFKLWVWQIVCLVYLHTLDIDTVRHLGLATTEGHRQPQPVQSTQGPMNVEEHVEEEWLDHAPVDKAAPGFQLPEHRSSKRLNFKRLSEFADGASVDTVGARSR